MYDSSPIVFESLESKTVHGDSVFSEVSYMVSGGKEVWHMRQSHSGPNVDKQKWDQVEIEVTTTSDNQLQADFYQLQPGARISRRKAPLKAFCFTCHSSGPRAIRPNYASKLAPVNLYDRLRISYWNLRIKFYGPMTLYSSSPKGGRRFRHSEDFANRKLEVKSCTTCHDGKKQLGHRNPLTFQNIGTIRFMLENRLMPPPLHSVTEGDMAAIEGFLGISNAAKINEVESN